MGNIAITNIGGLAERCNPVVARYPFFDKVNIRMGRKLTHDEMSFLRENATFADTNPGHYVRGFVSDVLTIVNPNEAALQLLVELPKAMVNWLEVAVDLIVDADTKWLLRDLFDQHFVQPWHGRHVQIRLDGGSYSGQAAAQRKFAWYASHPSKVSGEIDCFHLEGRYRGVQAVRRVGVERPRDLLHFDHVAYWAKHLTLFELDLERLGRHHLNRLCRGRRQHVLLREYRGGLVRNIDRAIGSALYRTLSVHSRQHCRSLQRFVDVYGRGPFLQPCHAPLLFNIKQSLLLKRPACSLDNSPVIGIENAHNTDTSGIEMGTG
jgi:hypothetical protein